MKTHLTNLAIATSIFINSVMGGNEREMLSSRCYRLRSNMYWGTKMFVIDFYFLKVFGEVDHCKNCYLYEEKMKCGKKY